MQPPELIHAERFMLLLRHAAAMPLPPSQPLRYCYALRQHVTPLFFDAATY